MASCEREKLRSMSAFCLLVAAQGLVRQNATSYSTTFSSFDASAWELQDDCSHCSGSTGDECTQMTPAAVQFGAVSRGEGAVITSSRRSAPSACGGQCDSGHLMWKPAVTFGTFTIAARWFGDQTNVSTADGFIGLWGAGALGGSITFIFHGQGWVDHSGNDFARTFQSEVYRTKQGHNKIDTVLGDDVDVAAGVHVYQLEWRTDRVHWRVDGKLVRTWHPDTNGSIPQGPLQVRLHSRSGHCSKLASGTSLTAQLLNFSYAPVTS